MLIVIGLMFSGIFMGYFSRQKKIPGLRKLISGTIVLLLFFLGINVGANRQIMDHLETIGVEALWITLGAVAGSTLCAWAIYRFYFQDKDAAGEAEEDKG